MKALGKNGMERMKPTTSWLVSFGGFLLYWFPVENASSQSPAKSSSNKVTPKKSSMGKNLRKTSLKEKLFAKSPLQGGAGEVPKSPLQGGAG